MKESVLGIVQWWTLARRLGSPKADAELKHFRSFGRGTVTSSFLYHYARLIEIIAGLERVERYVDAPHADRPTLRADTGINRLRDNTSHSRRCSPG